MSNQPLARIFDEIFDRKILKKELPYYKAYEEAEDEFSAEYKHRKYSNFDSYRKCRARRIKKR